MPEELVGETVEPEFTYRLPSNWIEFADATNHGQVTQAIAGVLDVVRLVARRNIAEGNFDYDAVVDAVASTWWAHLMADWGVTMLSHEGTDLFCIAIHSETFGDFIVNAFPLEKLTLMDEMTETAHNLEKLRDRLPG